ncbi:MAG: transcription-repair coupling factor [Bacteroidia bacterium]
MNTREYFQLFNEHPILLELERELIAGKSRLAISGAIGSFKPIALSHVFNKVQKNIVFCCSTAEEAEHFHADLLIFNPAQDVLLWKDSFRKSFDLSRPDNRKIQSRASVLDALSDRDKPVILVSYPEALLEKVVIAEEYDQNKWVYKVGEEVDLDDLFELMHEFHFEREDFVYEAGHFAVRGGIVDLYSFASELPIRMELDGRRIESIREFDPISQLSTKKLNRASIVPNIQKQSKQLANTDIFSYLGKQSIMAAVDLPYAMNLLKKGHSKIAAFSEDDSQVLFADLEELEHQLRKMQVIEFSQQHYFRPSVKLSFKQEPQPSINKNFNVLIEQLKKLAKDKYLIPFFSGSRKQIERLESIFDDLSSGINVLAVYKNLSEGFIDHQLRVASFTEHQIFNRYYRVRTSKQAGRAAISLKELRNLKPGDYVVHIDHGIGQFQGLQKMEMGGKLQEAVRIRYKNDDLLYVNIGALYKISKYKGQEGQSPSLNKLGSDSWKKLKSKTKSKVKDIARDLIKLYAKRKSAKGFAFAPDTYLQTELEASFMYEDTPDQAKAVEDVKKDMEDSSPMDRLICGDVGFGKTEVAIRAAFKAVTDSKQVAILVPTTILAQQHFHTFRDRLLDFPCKVDYINRFRSAKQQKETLAKLESGEVDIVIGTHKLLNKKTKFKDLGLLIIDEEQKFGVSAKERLKEFRTNVDTLTLTATPIPRTLHFSLMGARDLSIIQTPPPNRRPVRTEVHVWNNEIIQESIEHELERGGQVFVVHNRVKDINEIAMRISELVPKARVAVGHGQMKGDDLERVMVQFIEGEFDVLVATTIIESGLDIPNANTIIINNAHMFGLSDLHQMRGRVGRSNVKAYCHLLAPPLHSLPDDGRRRMQAIEEYADLGSGFNVAMRDLDIRGAGNLLGAEQSGFISEIGFQMYHKILDEAISELKEEEFKGLIEEDEEHHDVQCTVEPEFEALIPDSYVNNIAERISLYTQLSQIRDFEKLTQFRNELHDRFGNFPKELQSLFSCMNIKLYAEQIDCEKVKLNAHQMLLYFNNDLGEKFFQSGLFTSMLQKVNNNPRTYSLKQGKAHLILSIKNFADLEEAGGIVDALNSQ